MRPETEFEMVSRICARARWSTSGEHAKAVREVLAEARREALEEVEQRIKDVIAANRDMPDATAVSAVGERFLAAIRALGEK